MHGQFEFQFSFIKKIEIKKLFLIKGTILRDLYRMQNGGLISNVENYANVVFDSDNRTNDHRMDSLPNSKRMETTTDSIDENRADDDDINIQIYRFKFTDELNAELSKFAKVHQYDHRKVFKEAWEVWLEENENIVSSEVLRLTNLNYDGDILDKMFKSARYYYRKKGTEKKALAERRDYVAVQKDMLAAMDKHIKKGLKGEDYKPSDGFDEFCKLHLDLLKEEVSNLCKNGMTNSEEIKQKIKKTYKNRYFLIVQQCS